MPSLYHILQKKSIMCSIIINYIILLIFLSIFGSSDGLSKASKMPFLLTGIVLAIVYACAIFATFKTCKEPSSLDEELPPLDIKFAINEYIQVFNCPYQYLKQKYPGKVTYLFKDTDFIQRCLIYSYD